MKDGEMVTCSKEGCTDIVIRKRNGVYQWYITEDQYGKNWTRINLPDNVIETQIEKYRKDNRNEKTSI